MTNGYKYQKGQHVALWVIVTDKSIIFSTTI